MSEPTSSTSKRIHIFTGAPGSGKLVHIYHSPYLRRLPIYCCYHHNKAAWPNSRYQEIILCAYSAAAPAKDYWWNQALEFGFAPRLYVMMTEQGDTLTRMKARPRDNTLFKEVSDWYRWYTPHDMEEHIHIPPYSREYEKGAYQ